MFGVPIIDFIKIVVATEMCNVIALLVWVIWPIRREARRDARDQRREINQVLKRSGLDNLPEKNWVIRHLRK